jgi:hypothetical protein
MDRTNLDLLNRATDGREYVVGVATYQADCSYRNCQDHCEHHGVFRNVLPLIVRPKLLE